MYAFGAFELDPQTHELRRGGVRIKIQEQPFIVLVNLLERAGQLVTRDELRSALWDGDTFVDFDLGLNTAVKRLRETLCDSAEVPRFIETLPRLGYRFVAPVEVRPPKPPSAAAANTASGEKLLYQSAETYFAGLSWGGPDDRLALLAKIAGKNDEVFILGSDGKIERTLQTPLLTFDVAWNPDGSGLFLVGQANIHEPIQIWFESYPSGSLIKISHDLDDHLGVSVTGNGNVLVTTRHYTDAAIYVGDVPQKLSDKIDWKLSAISSERTAGARGLSWTGRGKLLQLDNVHGLFITDAQGGGRTQLADENQGLLEVAACGNSDWILESRIAPDLTTSVWKLNVATGETAQLFNAKSVGFFSCTPDGKSFVYDDYVTNTIYDTAMDGGVPREVAKGRGVCCPTISPDGKSLAYLKLEKQGAKHKYIFVVSNLEGGPALKEIVMPPDLVQFSPPFGWTPDGKGLTFLSVIKNARHLMMQPLAGGLPVQLTHFETEPSLILYYAWSQDGKELAVTRGKYNINDIIMFTGYR
jgi:DNA-binding winged helix-turn-helix (wHTH) protein/Tol biopolymer transport system component